MLSVVQTVFEVVGALAGAVGMIGVIGVVLDSIGIALKMVAVG